MLPLPPIGVSFFFFTPKWRNAYFYLASFQTKPFNAPRRSVFVRGMDRVPPSRTWEAGTDPGQERGKGGPGSGWLPPWESWDLARRPAGHCLFCQLRGDRNPTPPHQRPASRPSRSQKAPRALDHCSADQAGPAPRGSADQGAALSLRGLAPHGFPARGRPYPPAARLAPRAAPRPPTRGTSDAAPGRGRGARAPPSLPPRRLPARGPVPSEVTGGETTYIGNNCFLIGGGVRA